MQPLFHPGLGFSFVHRVASAAQTPQVLATVPEIQKLSRLGPAVGLEVADPGHSISQHQSLFGSTKPPRTASQCNRCPNSTASPRQRHTALPAIAARLPTVW